MHILMYRWKAYNYRDIEQTFLLLGHTVDNIEQHLGNYDIDPEFEKIIEHKIQETHYDMVFTVNYFALISNVCQKMGIKYVSWSCDNPLISMYHESIFHPCNYIFTFDKTNYQAEIPYYFKEGEDLVCFDGINDLCEKAEYYLAHEEERLAIAENGYRKVREHHNYIERINTMLDIIEENENQENDI